MAGFFISLDGIDGGGKSTQIKLLKAWFESLGRKVVTLRDPGGTTLGESLREILLHRQEIPLGMRAEMLLYMASRAELVEQVIQPALEAGNVVIADRYLLANVVYQGVAGKLGAELVWQVGQVATGGLMPNLTFILDLDIETSRQRIQGNLDRLESRGAEYMASVREGFLQQAKRPNIHAVVIDARRSIQEIHTQIISAISSLSI